MAWVLMFGALADAAGWREREITAPPKTLFALRDSLGRDNARLAAALTGRGVQTAVNQALIRGDVLLDPAAEVAFLAPMSGG